MNVYMIERMLELVYNTLNFMVWILLINVAFLDIHKWRHLVFIW